MNRRYTKEQYLDLAERIKKAVPGISLTTDIIVGFPGETDEDFEETMDVVRRVGFDSAFTFIYSKRTGTPAAAMEDQVPEAIVKERFDRLLKEVQDISAEVCGRDVRTVQEVLVEEVNDHAPGLMTGRLSNNTVVHLSLIHILPVPGQGGSEGIKVSRNGTGPSGCPFHRYHSADCRCV